MHLAPTVDQFGKWYILGVYRVLCTVIARGFKTNHHYWIIIRLNKRGSPLSMSKLQLGVTVKPPNKGCIGDSLLCPL